MDSSDIIDIIKRVPTADGIRPHVCTGIYEFIDVEWDDIDESQYEESLGASLPALRRINRDDIDEYERITLSLVPISVDVVANDAGV